MDNIARIYAERFSEQELKALIAFYKSPVGRKMVTDEPQIIDQKRAITRKTGATNLSDYVLSKFREEMKKKGHDL